MIRTENDGYPVALTRAIDRVMARYDAGPSDWTATQLPSPVREVVMVHAARAGDFDLTQHYRDLFKMFLGTCVHGALEDACEPEAHSEVRFFLDCGQIAPDIDGVILSGQADWLSPDRTCVKDYKFSSVYSGKEALAGNLKPEHIAQLNVLAYLSKYGYTYDGEDRVAPHGVTATRLLLGLGATDGRPSEAAAARKAEKPYPREYDEYPVPLWTESQTATYIASRVRGLEAAHAEYRDHGAVTVPCTPEQTWDDGPSYAVMKRGQKRAVKVTGLTSLTDATEWIAQQKDPAKLYAETRPGRKMNKCRSRNGQSYCLLASNGRCPQFRAYVESVTLERDGEAW